MNDEPTTPLPALATAPVRLTRDTFVRVLESGSEAFIALNENLVVIRANSEALRLHGKRSEEMVGQRYDFVWSTTVGTVVEEALYRASVERQVAHYELFSEEVDGWLEVSIYPAEQGGVHVFVRDISERKKAETELHRSAAVFRETQTRLELALQAVHLGLWEWDVRTGAQHWSEEQERLFGIERGGFQGGVASFLDIVHPEDRERAVASAQQCLTVPDGSEYEDEFRILRPNGEVRWIHGRARVERDPATGEPIRVTGVNLDVTERKVAEEVKADTLRREQQRVQQLRYLANASLRINSAQSLSTMFQVICDQAREIMGTHQALTSVTKGQGWAQAIHTQSLSDKFATRRNDTTSPEASRIYTRVYRENRVIRLTQTELENDPEWREFGPQSPMNGWLAAPLMMRDGTNLGLIQVGDRYEGEFTESDEAILVQLAQLASNAIENQRLYEEARARAEREELINRIGDGIRQALPPEEIEALAMRALGSTLGADRCYLMAVDLSRDVISIARDWCQDGVPSIAGQYPVSDLGEDFAALFASGETLVVSSATLRVNEPIGVTSFLHVPFYENDRIVGMLTVAMVNGFREWTEDEISLAETVAGQLRTALEAVRQQQRERNIAQQLQEALQPTIPDTIPGMLLASHYRAALEEAEVGGDFYDAFRLSNNRFALVVADLSGKGLGAARQVALTRHQLRYAIYTADLDGVAGLATAVQHLNRVLADYEQLTGFATLFVAIWDDAASTLTYVNAGQEPGLVWRAASGIVETLVPTGTVLGGFAEATFTQNSVTLAPGDVWTAFTDGMTEIGPTRKELLGIEGVVPIFAQCCAGYTSDSPTGLPDPRMILSGLIASVKGFGRGTGIRDDLCALVGIRQHP